MCQDISQNPLTTPSLVMLLNTGQTMRVGSRSWRCIFPPQGFTTAQTLVLRYVSDDATTAQLFGLNTRKSDSWGHPSSSQTLLCISLTKVSLENRPNPLMKTQSSNT
eukprot:PhF_6_TR7052/c1_g1_i1/m.10616